jgi:hypothetical protein
MGGKEYKGNLLFVKEMNTVYGKEDSQQSMKALTRKILICLTAVCVVFSVQLGASNWRAQASVVTNVFAFGSNNSGQLGLGDKSARQTPTLVEGLAGAIAVSPSDAHTLVLMENGDVYSFGIGLFGALGHGDEEDQLTPRKIEGISNAVAIAVNGNYAAEQNRDLHSFVVTADGSVYSFGRSRNGVLGHGINETSSERVIQSTPKKIEKFMDGYSCDMRRSRAFAPCSLSSYDLAATATTR